MQKLIATTLLLVLTTVTPARAGGGLYICAERVDEDDWEFEFHAGAVTVPAGTVFDYAGHVLSGNLQDPLDLARRGADSKGISEEEEKRRSALVMKDIAIDHKNTSGVVTTGSVTLTKVTPCALAPAKALLSRQWGWTAATIVGDDQLYYKAYGVLRRGALDTNFPDDTVPLNQLAARGELNASVRGTIKQAFRLDEWTAAQPPDDDPVMGKGNAECWGDDSRQDMSCRALTDKLLLSLRGAARAEVRKAMGVSGRETEEGLRFLSNYSRGERWGSGSVNFTFDPDGRVAVIYASIDPPGGEGKSADFIWNSERLPKGCSDLPHSHLRHCNDP